MIVEKIKMKDKKTPLPLPLQRVISVKSHAQNDANVYADKKKMTNTLINVFIIYNAVDPYTARF